MAGQTDGGAAPHGVPDDAPPPYRSMASFVTGLREGDHAALRAYYLLYAPLLRAQARRMGVPEDERADLVMTVLNDVLLRVQTADLPPRELGRYVVGSLRNRVRTGHRDRVRRDAREEGAYSAQAGGGQRIVAECHSEYGIRSAGAADGDASLCLSSALRTLARWSAQSLGPEDVALMIGISNQVPLRDLAARAGITYGAARVRVHRLRERMPRLARQYVTTLDEREQAELERFFRRAGIVLREDDERTSRSPRQRGTPMAARRDGGDDA